MSNLSGVPNKDITWKPIPPESLDLKGKKVVVVGGTGGIGRALSRLMADRNAEVTVIGRTFRDGDVAGISFCKADLELMSEANLVGRKIIDLDPDLIVFTTGIFAGPKREETSEGIERDMAVSYLSRLAILQQVCPGLNEKHTNSKDRPRIFIMGFPGTNIMGNIEDLNSEKSYSSWPAHKNTVAGNEALVLYGTQQYPNIKFYGLNPGLVKSNIRSNVLGGQGSIRQRIVEWFIGILMDNVDNYARRIVPLLFSGDIESASGVFFNRKAIAILPSEVMTLTYVSEFIKASEKLLMSALRNPDSK